MDIAVIAVNWPIDWIIIGAFAALAAFDAYRSGTARAATVALVFPVTLFALAELPKTAFLASFSAQFSTPVMQTVLLAVFFVIFYVMIRRMVGLWGDGAMGPLPALIAGIAVTIIVVCMWLQLPELNSLWHFGHQVQAVFSASYRLLWVFVAYAALAYVRS
jgi:uncharacterized membrane protein YGL010W